MDKAGRPWPWGGGGSAAAITARGWLRNWVGLLGCSHQIGLFKSGLPAEEWAGGSVSALAGHSTELVRDWGCQEGVDTVVAGAGLPLGHGEAEALQEAGEEEEELHAGQGLPKA